MEWDIKSLDCSKMLINPNDPKLVTFMEKNIPALKKRRVKFQEKVFTKSQVYRYILLLYDPHSEIVKMQQLEWFGMKYQAVGYAGFKLSNGNDGHPRFPKVVDEMVFGKNNAINDMIADFLSWSNNQQWQYMIFLKESMNGFVRDAIGRRITKHNSSGDYMKLQTSYFEEANKMVKADKETDDFMRQFYYNIEKSRMSVQPEDYSKALADKDDLRADNPYGVNYVIDKIRFLGDEEDKVEAY